MKKRILIISLIICSLLLTGCGININKTGEATNKEKILECKKTTNGTLTFNTIMDYHYVDGLINKVVITYDYDLSGYTEESRKLFADSKLCTNASIKNTLGMNDCTERLNGTSYIVTGTATKLKSQVKETLVEAKTALEKDNWTCIIK